MSCPCGRGLPYADCCGPCHAGTAAATAEALMRSRYSAFVLGDTGYLLRTWHPSSRPASLALDPGRRWTGLRVLATTGGGFLDTEGTVEFEASYIDAGRAGSQRERSRFVRDGGRWSYLSGS